MLHAAKCDAYLRGAPHCVLRRGVIGVQIMRQDPRPDSEQFLVQGRVLHKRLVRLVVIQVAQVVTQDGLPAAAQREGRLELAAHREDRTGTLQWQRDRRAVRRQN